MEKVADIALCIIILIQNLTLFFIIKSIEDLKRTMQFDNDIKDVKIKGLKDNVELNYNLLRHNLRYITELCNEIEKIKPKKKKR